MVQKYLPYAGYESAGSPGRTGDGVKMLESAGAKLVNMNVCMQAGLWLKDVPTDLQFGKDGVTNAHYVRLLAALFQPYLKTSLRGDRVAAETLPLEYISNAYEEVGGEGFAVFDNATREEMINEGLVRGYFGMVTPGTKFSNFDELFARGEKDGFCFKAATLEELAAKTGMDPQRLTATASRMNELVKLGKDEDFYKDAQWLREVKTGPFYAIKGSLRMYATTGGASVNENFQPLNADGEPIPGIYAIGQDAGGLYSDSYDMHIAEGTASSWAINGGKLAVEHFVKTRK
jgi:succinate dehydrogenase